ncbi:4Fe-4S dicluster domain-containing protein [Bacteroides salyersiae]|nr:4Fe-4S dicluster domain-containing protein [Bacteroides salyersiae]
MIDIKDKALCCGCSACAQSCPCQCIRMVVDKEGFFYPQVDEFSCINCGLCNKVCPFENPYDSVIPVSTIAYKHSNDVIREHSSSGGAFSTLAEYVINQGGVVFGKQSKIGS